MSRRAESLSQIDSARAVLLDFDGPVCSLFAGHPAGGVTEKMRGLIASTGAVVTDDMLATTDPLAVLRMTADLYPHLITQVDDGLTREEFLAARTARSTPGCLEFLVECERAGKPVVIVSNNSARGVEAYFEERRHSPLVARILGRPAYRPDRMKPDPAMIRDALDHLGVRPDQTVLIGDSVTDIEGARACAVPSIGLANRPYKLDTLTRAGADTVVRSMTALLLGNGRPGCR